MPLKELHSAAELRAHYREVQARMRAAAARAPPPPPPPPTAPPADGPPQPRPRTPIQRIIAAVALQFDVPVSLMISPRRTADVVLARSVAIYLVSELTGYGQTVISAAFGKRDNNTVNTAVNSVRRRMAGDAPLARTVEMLHASLLKQRDGQ